MTMKGEPVPPEGLDHIKTLQKWLEQHPNDVMVRSKLAEIHRDPRFAEPDEPDDIMPQIPELAEFPVPPGLKKYIDATRIVAGASVPTSASAACVAAAFNLLAAEDIDVQSRANAPHPSGLYPVPHRRGTVLRGLLPALREGLIVMVPTNFPFNELTEGFGSERLTGALLYRLTHHVHILEMNGESYRLKCSRENAQPPAPDDPDEE